MSKAFHLENIFAVMCRLVNTDYNKVNRTKKDWYWEHEWSIETDRLFRDWYADYLHKMSGAQRELYNRKYMSKADCIKAAEWFLLDYGWKIKSGESIE
jgi:hypothetical protein